MQRRHSATAVTEHRLLEEYEVTVKSQARRFKGVPQDRRKDIEQAGRVAALLAARSFEPGRGVQFATYAFHFVRRAMLAELSREVEANARSVEEVDAVADHRAFDVADRLAVRRFVVALPPREEALVRAVYYDDLKPAEAARTLQMSRMHAGRLLDRVYKSAREAFDGAA